MIVLTWSLFGLLALFWTGAAWITAAGTQWVAQALASGTAAEAARDLAALPVPEWLKFWIEPGWVQALQAALQWVLDGAGASLPFAGAAAGWLVPAIWVAWALGLILLVACGAGAHTVLRRFARRPMARIRGERQFR